ncbi:hypothetical protein BJ138DRAFT_496036 [Hygrophoropsis aurantiaca]|uniref:Uncharacterized protein n=1 Tax=Hygrophoropsis aurantiaca TaxID=72124 RepID=A0ACB8A478_9AGAM|nr:hypothetical protein BJ138DRAFT_496036 [Hygrophoropsis aurantiaca]
MSIKAKDPTSSPDPKACAALITDDHCRKFLEKARMMKTQVGDISSQEPHGIRDRSLKRGRDGSDGPDWERNPRPRSQSELSRSDSDGTFVGNPVKKAPPTAPRAMRQAAQLALQGNVAERRYSADNLRSPRSPGFIRAPDRPTPRNPASLTSITQQPKITDATRETPIPRSREEDHSAERTSISHDMSIETHSQQAELVTQHISHELPTPEVVSTEKSSETSTIQSSPLSIPSEAPQVSHSIPRIWITKTGLSEPDIVDIEFEVGADLLVHTAECVVCAYYVLPISPSLSRRSIKFRLLCLPTNGANEVITRITTEEPLDINIIQSVWPQGKFTIALNLGTPYEKTWLPYEIASIGSFI